MENELAFLNSHYVLYALLLVPLAMTVLYAERKRRAVLCNLGRIESHHAFLLRLIPAGLCLLIGLALLRPYWGYDEISIKTEGRDFVVVFDISHSMLTHDVQPSRLIFAKRKLLDFVRLLERDHNGDRVGIVLFAGESYLFCPPTADYEILQSFTKAIDTDLISSHGSAVSDALESALRSFEETRAIHPQVVLLSDGEDEFLDPDSVSTNFRNAEIPIHVLGIGTPLGQPIPLSRGRFVRNKKGEIVISKLNENALSHIASATNGSYQKASLSDRDLLTILQNKKPDSFSLLPAQDASEEQSSKVLRTYREYGALILWIPLLVMILALFSRHKGIAFCWLIMLPLPHSQAQAEQAQTNERNESRDTTSTLSVYEAYRAFKNGEYENAEKGFLKALKSEPQNLDLKQALASSLYKQEKFQDALRHFEELPPFKDNGRREFERLYNLGNANFMTQNYEQAISQYDKALLYKPQDTKALFNKELAEKLLQEAKQKEQEQEQNEEQEKDQQEESSQGSSSEPQDGDKSEEGDADKSEDQRSASDKQKADGDTSEPKEGPKKKPESQNQSSEEDKSQQQNSGGEQDANETSQGAGDSTGDQRDKDENEQSPSAQAAGQPVPGQEQNPQALAAQEARSWLDSLPETSILYQQQTGRRQQGGEQTW